MNRVFKMMVVASAALMLALGLSACSSNESGYSGPVAATVNGENIYEEQVTEYVDSLKATFGAEDYEGLMQTMSSMGMDAAALREQAINSLANNVVIRQAAEDNGIKLDEAYVENTLASYKSSYETDEEWEEYLTSAGTTEEKLRSQIEDSYFQSQVMQKLVKTPVPTDEEVQKAIDDSIQSYSGKRSSHILFNEEDEAKAKEVLQQLKDGADFAELAKANSQDTGSAENGGDVGWDGESSFVEEYQNALDGLSKGEMTQDLVKSEYGYHIILCTDERTFDADTKYTRENIPEDIFQEIYLDLQSSMQQNAYNEYVSKLVEGAEIVINDMPADVPYNITSEDGAEGAEGDQAAEGEEADDGHDHEGHDHDHEGEAAEGDQAAEGDAASEEKSAENQ